MKKYAVLLASVLCLGFANAEPVEIASTSKRNSVWVMYTETFTRMKDAYSVIIAERDNSGQANESRMYVGVLHETCANGHGVLYARLSPQAKWEMLSTVTLGSPTTVADVAANVICNVGKRVEQKSTPEKGKFST